MKVFEILSTVPYPGYKGKGSDFRAYDEPDMPKMHTQPRNYAIIINGKPWKVVRNLNHARSIENTLKSKGKEVEVKITDEPVSENIPMPVTKRQAALKKQSDAALLKSKTTDSGIVDRMNIVNKDMKDKVAQTQADADKLSKAAGIDPKTVQKDINKSMSGQPKLKDKFRKNTAETTASSVATVVGNIGTTHSRNMYNTDGTMKNGLNFGNLLGGNKKPDKKKKTKKNT